MANRIQQVFADLRAQKRRAIMPFLTAGYPTLDATVALLPALEKAGASICELGFPFSDPIADGPVISASMTEALRHHVTAAEVFEMVAKVRPTLKMGLVAMVTYSIVYKVTPRKFVADAKAAGLDGFIFPDLPLEESATVGAIVRDAGMTASLLIAPTTPDDRAWIAFVSLLSCLPVRETGASAQPLLQPSRFLFYGDRFIPLL